MATSRSRTSTKTTTAETETKPERKTKDNTLLKARHAAVDRLIGEHNVEFQGYYVEEAKRLGVEYTPPLSPTEKARQQIEALYAEHPELRPQAEVPASVTSPGSEPPSPVEAGDLAAG